MPTRSSVVQCWGSPDGFDIFTFFTRAVQMARAMGEEEGVDATARRYYRRNSVCEAPSATAVPREQTLSVSGTFFSPLGNT